MNLSFTPLTSRPTSPVLAPRSPRWWSKPLQLVQRIHRDEQGAEGLEKLLIIAAVVLPLLGLLIVFRNEMGDWVRTTWDGVRNAGEGGVPGSGATTP